MSAQPWHLEAGVGALQRLVIATPLAAAHIYLHGAHVTHFQPAGQEPVLFLSQKSEFAGGKPIRGGVPVIFPWFGQRAGDSQAPLHGLARLLPWELRDVRQESDGRVTAVLAISDNAHTRALWPQAFELVFTVRVGRELEMELTVHNRDAGPMRFEEALHTYLRVGDVRQASVGGLAGVHYIDRAGGQAQQCTQDDQPIRFQGETDRIYRDTHSACELEDPVFGRMLRIEKSGSATTVVWNPWVEKAKRMPDFGDEEWPEMACIETVNAGPNSVEIPPGGQHTMRAVVQVIRG